MKDNIQFGSKIIGQDSPAFIIAELSCNHNQDLNLALKTIDAIKESGADCVKIQTSKPDGITVDSNKEYFKIKGGLWDNRVLYDLYKEAYTPWEWTQELKQYTESKGMEFFSSPFDLEAVDFLEQFDVPAYKIASFEIQDIPLIEKVAKTGKPIIISTGIASKEDIQLAINTCLENSNDQIIILKCTSAYPTKLSDVNLNMISKIRKDFNCLVGLSDHTMGSLVAKASIPLGAKVIEKHFILDREIGGPDSAFSMEPNEFKEMVDGIREVEMALGIESYELTEKAKKNKMFGRSLFVVRDVKKGEILSSENVKSVRPNNGLHPKFLKEVLGQRFNEDLEKGTPLSFNLISN